MTKQSATPVRQVGRTSWGATIASGGTNEEWLAGNHPFLYMGWLWVARLVRRPLVAVSVVAGLLVLRLVAGSWTSAAVWVTVLAAAAPVGLAGAAAVGHRPPSLRAILR